MISELQYNGEIEGKKCAICKLTLEKDDVILFCPECETLFHEEHLLDWLADHNDCPVCGRDFSYEIEKYSLRNNYIDKSVDLRESDMGPERDLTFHNPKPNVNPKAAQILLIVLGLFVAFMPIGSSVPFIDFPSVIIVLLFSYIFFLVGMAMIKRGTMITKNNVANFWETITFKERGIVIKKLDSVIVEIEPKNIQSIHIIRGSYRPEDEATRYNIRFEIIRLGNERLHFGKVFITNEELARNQFYYQIREQIKNLYNIEPNLPSSSKKSWKNYRFFIITTISYILISAVLITINYLF